MTSRSVCISTFIGRSSLGELGVVMLRSRTPCHISAAIVARSESENFRGLGRGPRHTRNAELAVPQTSHGGDLEPATESSRMSKSTRNAGESWSRAEVARLRDLAQQNTPTRVIGLKLGRTENAVRSKASEVNVSLKPTNQSPYNRRSK
jgi:hypothetical protein